MSNTIYEVHMCLKHDKGFEFEAEFDTYKEAQRYISREARSGIYRSVKGDPTELFKIVERDTPTIDLLNGSVTDRINYIKSLNAEKLAAELKATKPLLVQHKGFNDYFAHEIIDGEVKTIITAFKDSNGNLNSLGMTISVNDKKVFGVDDYGSGYELDEEEN